MLYFICWILLKKKKKARHRKAQGKKKVRMISNSVDLIFHMQGKQQLYCKLWGNLSKLRSCSWEPWCRSEPSVYLCCIFFNSDKPSLSWPVSLLNTWSNVEPGESEEVWLYFVSNMLKSSPICLHHDMRRSRRCPPSLLHMKHSEALLTPPSGWVIQGLGKLVTRDMDPQK